MELTIGQTYKSPKYSRYIEILAVSDEGKSYALDILWVDTDRSHSEPDYLLVTKDEIENWIGVA